MRKRQILFGDSLHKTKIEKMKDFGNHEEFKGRPGEESSSKKKALDTHHKG